ncbi:MAG: methyltransferase domain-containing protein [Flavisolibacter sp.]|nr:methyltransferase domain-containing protein [Flavisolibacter sp.]
MDDLLSYFEANKKLWNQKTPVHKDSDFYDVPSFLDGKSSLNAVELNELGDIKGKKILHLQCHFGMDSLSLARMGASVTGVDFSDAAINEARALNEKLGLDVQFICANIYDLPSELNDQFDIVFTSYGVIGWLPDLDKWASVINAFLKPGGFFYMVEFHPVVWMFDDEFIEIKYYYDNRELIVIDAEGTYADNGAPIKAKEYSWNHSISEVLNALIHAGLKLEHFNEYSYSPYACFKNLVKGDDGNYRVKGMEGKIPMIYSLRASK